MLIRLTKQEALNEIESSINILLASLNLEENDYESEFDKVKASKCVPLIHESQLIVKDNDNGYMKIINLFTEKQNINNIKPIGWQHIILIQKK